MKQENAHNSHVVKQVKVQDKSPEQNLNPSNFSPLSNLARRNDPETRYHPLRSVLRNEPALGAAHPPPPLETKGLKEV